MFINDFFLLKERGIYKKISFNDIIYFKSSDKYVVIHCKGRTFIVFITLRQLESQLPDNIFLRIHRSYIISLSHLTSCNHNSVLLEKTRLPIGRRFRKKFKQRVSVFGNKDTFILKGQFQNNLMANDTFSAI